MKIQYRSIAGQLVPEEWRDSCEYCCFDFNKNSFPICLSPININGILIIKTNNPNLISVRWFVIILIPTTPHYLQKVNI